MSNEAPHTTLAGDPSVACPFGADFHGTPAEVVLHMERHDRNIAYNADRIKGARLIGFFNDLGDFETAGRIAGAINEIVINDVIAEKSVIETPVGNLTPGEKVTITYQTRGDNRRLKNVTVGKNPGASRYVDIVFTTPGYQHYRVRRDLLVAIER